MKDLRSILGIGKPGRTENYDDELSVVEEGHSKALKCGNVVYSRISSDSLYTHEYWDFFIPLPYAFENPRILMIGLGGGTIAKQLTSFLGTRLSLDVVESDERMVRISKKFIGEGSGFRIVKGDGADYVSKREQNYDAIILDAYSEGLIPGKFLEMGFIRDAFLALGNDGILAVNCTSMMDGTESLDDYSERLSSLFTVYKLDTSGYSLNSVLICSKSLDKKGLLGRITASFPESSENAFLLRGYERMYSLRSRKGR
jgi:spermidine synthase